MTRRFWGGRMNIKAYAVAAIASMTLGVLPASAATIVSTLASYNGPEARSGFPIDRGIIGTFNYAIAPGSSITSAFLEGTYGTSTVSSSTASFNASVDGNTAFTVCGLNAMNCYFSGQAYRSFSIALSSATFASLLDGSASLRLIQTSNVSIRYGTPTLRIVTAAVPEPSTWAMMLIGFGGAGAMLRRSKRKAATKVSFAL